MCHLHCLSYLDWTQPAIQLQEQLGKEQNSRYLKMVIRTKLRPHNR